MRIAWLVYGAIEQTTGGYIYDRKVTEGLRDHGDLVDVISLEQGAAPDPATLCGYDAVVADELCFREVGPLFRALSGSSLCVLLVHHLTVWESRAEQPELLAMEREALAAASVCVATSTFTRERLLAEGLARDVWVAEPGADRLPRLARRVHEGLRFLFIGNLVPRKGVLELLAAFAELEAPTTELVLVGDPEREPGYAVQVRGSVAGSPELSRRVRIAGLLDDEQLARELAEANALVLPSALEGYGIVLGEALYAGVPLIAARVGAAAELIAGTQAGLSYLPGDQRGLSRAMRDFASDAVLRGKLAERAAFVAPALPTWSETVNRFRATLARAP